VISALKLDIGDTVGFVEVRPGVIEVQKMVPMVTA
jgi:hypothetical protein